MCIFESREHFYQGHWILKVESGSTFVPATLHQRPPPCQRSCLIEMNNGALTHIIVSLNTAGLLFSSRSRAGFPSRLVNPSQPVLSQWQTVSCATAWSEKGVCCLIESSSSIDAPVSSISEQNSISSSCRQQLITSLSHQAEPSVRKTIFLSFWIQLILSINLTDEVSCTKSTDSGVLLSINCINIHPETECGQESTDWWSYSTQTTLPLHSLFKHLETAILANSIDFPPKQIRGLSSIDGKQSIREIGCHCAMQIAQSVICSPTERGRDFLYKQKRTTGKRKSWNYFYYTLHFYLYDSSPSSHGARTEHIIKNKIIMAHGKGNIKQMLPGVRTYFKNEPSLYVTFGLCITC